MDKSSQTDAKITAQEYAKAASRIMDSVSRTAQISSLATPEMQDMFTEWVNIVGRQVISGLDMPGNIDVETRADEIGISGSTLLGMLLYLHRRGTISIKGISIDKGNGSSDDTCSCNKE